MKNIFSALVVFVLILQSLTGAALGASPREIEQEGAISIDMPGYPLPQKPVPYHEPGHFSNAMQYTTQVQTINEDGQVETTQLSGLDAMAADGIDPLAGNYTLVSLDKIARYSMNTAAGPLMAETFRLSDTLDTMPVSNTVGNYLAYDVAAGDLNGDYVDEQIGLYLGDGNTVNLRIGEMPGAPGKAASAPAVVSSGTDRIDVLVRGYDYALWHCLYDPISNECAWDAASSGGLLLSAPAVVSKGAGAFDVYAILSDGNLSNQVYRRSYQGSDWSGDWQAVGSDAAYWAPLADVSPVPELPAPAVAEVGGVTYLFRNDASHPLSWWNSATTTWESLEIHGLPMLDFAPAVLSLDADSFYLLSVNAGGTLMMRKYTIATGQWGDWVLARDLQKNSPGMEDVTAYSAPLAVASNDGIDIYLRGSDDQLWKLHCSASITRRGDCGAWQALAGALASDIGGALLAGQPYLFSLTGTSVLQSYNAADGWQAMPDGITPCCAVFDLGTTGVSNSIGNYNNYSVDVETGHFLGDGRSQIVVGYFSSGNSDAITLALYDISDSTTARGFRPELLTQVAVSDGFASHFRIATGDFVGQDGYDDIAFFNFHADQKFYTVYFYQYDAASQQLIDRGHKTDESPYVNADYLFGGTLNIAGGDFNGDGADELAVLTGWVNDNFDTYDSCWNYDYTFYTFIFYLKSLNNVERVNIGQYARDVTKDAGSKYVVQLAMTAGDANGDGRDEIVRTWPDGDADFDTEVRNCGLPFFQNYTLRLGHRFHRVTQVLSFNVSTDPVNPSFVLSAGSPATVTNSSKGPSQHSYGDRLATGDFDLDLKDEMLWQEWNDSNQWLHVYEQDGGSYGEVANLGNLSYSGWARYASGDFTGESLRLGSPSYRVQTGMVTPLVLLNMPPQHRDMIGGEEISVGADSIASYTYEAGQEIISTAESQRDWSLSTGLELSGGAFGASATASLNNTYGENFSNTTEQLTSWSLTQQVDAYTSDQVLYNATDYEVWEYPVYGVEGGAHGPPAIVVVFPRPVQAGMTNIAQSKEGNYCSESFYAPRHQPYNVWSYDRAGLNGYSFPDRDETQTYYHSATAGGSALTINISSGTTLITENSSNNAFTAGVELSYENELELPVGGEAFEYSFKANVEGSYNTSSVNTLNTQLTSGTTVNVNIPAIDPTDAMITEVFIYWAKAGYLVIDYQTDPGMSAPLWSTDGAYYNLPDPAFILPWYGWLSDGEIVPICVGKQLFTHDIGIQPSYAENGDTVELSATLRNFSYKASTQPIAVNFYLGEPAAGNPAIASCSIAAADLVRAKGPQTCTAPWQVTGASGGERIYAVIDPSHILNEVHEEGDIIDNNTGYNLLYTAETDYIEPSAPADRSSYQVINYLEAAGQDIFAPASAPFAPQAVYNLEFGLYAPTNLISDTLRYQLMPVEITLTQDIVGSPIQVTILQADATGELKEVIVAPFSASNPAIFVAGYRDSDLYPGVAENELNLYRWSGSVWNLAVCPGYEVVRFPIDNTLAVPVCQTGIYALRQPHAPATPLLTSPANNAAASNPVTFTWQAVTGAASYILVVDGAEVTTILAPSTSYRMTLDAGQHTWTVIAVNDAGQSAPAAAFTFIISNRIYLPATFK